MIKRCRFAKAETLSKGKWSTRNTAEVRLQNKEVFNFLRPGLSHQRWCLPPSSLTACSLQNPELFSISSIVLYHYFPLLCIKNYIIEIAPSFPLLHPYWLHSLHQKDELMDFHFHRFHLHCLYSYGQYPSIPIKFKTFKIILVGMAADNSKGGLLYVCQTLS